MPERLKAFPTLESRRRIAQRVRDMPNNGGLDLAWPPVVEDVDSAEEKPTGPLTTQFQHDEIIRNIANLTLGGEAAAKAHVVTRQQQRDHEAKLAITEAESSRAARWIRAARLQR